MKNREPKPNYESLYKNLYNQIFRLHQRLQKYESKEMAFCGLLAKWNLGFLIELEKERLPAELTTRPKYFWNTRPGKLWRVKMQYEATKLAAQRNEIPLKELLAVLGEDGPEQEKKNGK